MSRPWPASTAACCASARRGIPTRPRWRLHVPDSKRNGPVKLRPLVDELDNAVWMSMTCLLLVGRVGGGGEPPEVSLAIDDGPTIAIESHVFRLGAAADGGEE